MTDPRAWKLAQRRLGYTDQEAEEFRANPRNAQVLEKGAELLKVRFRVEIIQARGCNSRHRVGDVLYLDGYGNLITEDSPNRICIFALGALTTLVFAAHELIYAGVDPNEMRFNTVDCTDVGLECGGWGKVVLRLTCERT